MKEIAVTLIVDGSFKNVVLPVEFVKPLAEGLRTEGKATLHLANGSIEADGILIMAKGSKTRMMLLPMGEDE